jgi:hypothetical protein
MECLWYFPCESMIGFSREVGTGFGLRPLTAAGYGSIYWDGKRHPAHRFIYERLVEPVPRHLDMDHLCRVRECVNPAHLEPVTPGVNMLRGVAPAANAVRTNQCFRGHEYTPETLDGLPVAKKALLEKQGENK